MGWFCPEDRPRRGTYRKGDMGGGSRKSRRERGRKIRRKGEIKKEKEEEEDQEEKTCHVSSDIPSAPFSAKRKPAREYPNPCFPSNESLSSTRADDARRDWLATMADVPRTVFGV